MAEFVLSRLLWFSLLLTVSAAAKICTIQLLQSCQQQIRDENVKASCDKLADSAKCVSDNSHCENSKRLRDLYRKLQREQRLLESRCFTGRTDDQGNQCNETQVRLCYHQFNANSSHICTEVMRLKLCVKRLTGCHEMRHPSFAGAQKILDDHSGCFVNYSIILESRKTEKGIQRYDKTTQSSSMAPTNSTNSSALEEEELSTSYLPYTFVVVATVCTCLFLIVLIIFSIVRHTMLTRHRQNSTVEHPPTRIRIRARQRSRHRTRPYNYHHRRSHRRHMYVITGARQTVTGFFEGNVPPPPYNSVLDDNQSLRAGDPPPPYRPPSFAAIGVIV